ncbi:MAG: YbaN family protein [Alphaproteobacteria bacterium]
MTRTVPLTPPGLRPVFGHVWTGFGALALGIGALGLVLPLLPTTPFVILAALAFSKGSPRFARALHGHRVFGPIIAEWRARGAIAPRYKALALAMMGAALAASVALAFSTAVIALQALAMTGAAAFILSRPNATA